MPIESATKPSCPHCSAVTVEKDGRGSATTQRFRCRSCGRTFTERTATPFAGYRWPRDIIATALRWYGRFRLSLADVRDLLAERGVDVSPRTIPSGVHTFGRCSPPRPAGELDLSGAAVAGSAPAGVRPAY